MAMAARGFESRVGQGGLGILPASGVCEPHISAAEVSEIKRTYQPKKRYRRRVHGFLNKMRDPAGRRILRNRRRKGRHQLTPQ